MNPTDPDIKRFINHELLPRLEEMAELRRARGRLFYLSAMVSTVVVVVMVGAYGFSVGVDEMSLLNFGVLLLAVLAYGAALHGVFHLVFVRGWRHDYMNRIAAPLVDRMHGGVEYDVEEVVSRQAFEGSGLAQLPVDRFHGGGRFSASLEAGEVEFSEVVASCRVRPHGKRHVPKRTCFLLRGLFFTAEVGDHFRGTTVITPTLRRVANAEELPRVEVVESDVAPLVRPAEDWPHLDWTPQLHEEPIDEIAVSDPEFRAFFDVYATSTAEARALLGPAVMERLKRAYEVWRSPVHRTPMTDTEGAGHFTVVIRGGRVHLARPMPRTLVEIRSFEPADQAELLLQFARDVRLGLEVVAEIVARCQGNRISPHSSDNSTRTISS